MHDSYAEILDKQLNQCRCHFPGLLPCVRSLVKGNEMTAAIMMHWSKLFYLKLALLNEPNKWENNESWCFTQQGITCLGASVHSSEPHAKKNIWYGRANSACNYAQSLLTIEILYTLCLKFVYLYKALQNRHPVRFQMVPYLLRAAYVSHTVRAETH